MPEPKEQLATEQDKTQEKPQLDPHQDRPFGMGFGLEKMKKELEGMLRDKVGKDRCWASEDVSMLEAVLKRFRNKTTLEPKTLVLVEHHVGIVVGPAKFPFTPPFEPEWTGRPFMGIKLDTEVLILDDNRTEIRLENGTLLHPFMGTQLDEARARATEGGDAAKFDEAIVMARQAVDDLLTKQDFKQGDLVTWKPKLDDRKMNGTFIFLKKIKTIPCEKDQAIPDGSYVDCQILCEMHKAPCVFQVESRRLRKV